MLWGCATGPDQPAPQKRDREQPTTVDDLVVAANNASSPASDRFLLRAARLAASDDPDSASRILARIDRTQLDDASLLDFILLQGNLSIQAGNADAALAWLRSQALATIPLTDTQQVAVSRARARAYALERSYFNAAKELAFINDKLPTTDRPKNQEAIYAALMQTSPSQLLAAEKTTINTALRGWISLAMLSRRYRDSPVRQLAQLQRWRTLWGSHPAAIALPRALNLLDEVVRNTPRRVALILPLQGDLGPLGRAIRDGFLAAHFQRHQLAPGSVTAGPTVRVYDTTEGSIVDHYQQALADGAEFVVGPLDRERVTTLGSVALNRPVLALNRANRLLSNENLYQFGLAPEDELLQVVEQVAREGKQRALVIVPDDAWGERNLATFTTQWEARGGEIAATARFTDARDYSDVVKRLLTIDQSEVRSNRLRQIIATRFEFRPRRRQDADFIFLLANPEQASGLNPALAFFYADDLPVYSTSHVHVRNDPRIQAMDLNNIRFSEIPWNLPAANALRDAVTAMWPDADGQLAPFYAMGADAYQLYPRLSQLKAAPSQRIFGTTGVLSLNARNIIQRRLMWAQFRGGKVIAAPLVMTGQARPGDVDG